MENGYYAAWKSVDSLQWLENVDEEKELNLTQSMPAIPQIRTPGEPMEFLARSWSLSASDIPIALSKKQQQFVGDRNPDAVPVSTPLQGGRGSPIISISTTKRLVSLGKWFHKDSRNSRVKRKDKMRVENARMHSAVSIAGLAAALATMAAAQKANGSGSKMDLALASAAQLLASHCLELADASGADQARLDSVVRSAIDVQTAGDLLTLTAAAATALRGESALKARFPKEPKKNATISAYDRCVTEKQYAAAVQSQLQEQNPPVVGELLQLTQKGVMQWKIVSVYINKRSQVMVMIKSKKAGGAFCKTNRCLVYGICDETAAWPYKRERESSEEVYFGLKTGQGLMEFKCKNKIHKQKWVDGMRDLFCQVSCIEATGLALEFLNVGDTI